MLDAETIQGPIRVLAVMSRDESLRRLRQRDDVARFERPHDIESFREQRWRMVAEGIGHQAQADEFGIQGIEVMPDLAPVLAAEERIQARDVAIGGAGDPSAQHMTAAVRQQDRQAEFCERLSVLARKISAHTTAVRPRAL